MDRIATGLLVAVVLAPALFAARPAGPARPGPSTMSEIAVEMAAAGSNLLASLSADQRRRSSFLFRDQERKNFHFFPIPRRGVPIKELSVSQQQLVYALLSTALSAAGVTKTLTVMSQGAIVRMMEPDSLNRYTDSDQYHFIFFGKPDPKGTWAWRIEGFHLSLNVTLVDGKAVVEAPSFIGFRPATVTEGPHQGLRVLAREEDLGRQLAASLTAGQRRIGFFPLPDFATETVGGFLSGNVPKLDPRPPDGLPGVQMTHEQLSLLQELVLEHVYRHRPELATRDIDRITEAGWDKVHFRWAGSLQPMEGHHYVIQGPTFLIEYDNTQDGANHVHCIWRDLENDFGDDLLRRHYAEKHGRK